MTKTSAGHRGYTLKRRQKEYKRTGQQSLFAKVAEMCGIKKGISKEELQDKMKNCVPKAYQELRKE